MTLHLTARQTTAADLTGALLALAGAIPVERHRLDDDTLTTSWRSLISGLDDTTMFVRSHMRVIRAGRERPAYIEQTRRKLAWRLSDYVERVDLIEKREAEMQARGIGFIRGDLPLLSEAELAEAHAAVSLPGAA